MKVKKDKIFRLVSFGLFFLLLAAVIAIRGPINKNSIQSLQSAVLVQGLPLSLQLRFRPYAKSTLMAAQNGSLDPLWPVALMWTESDFNSRARSSKGALGLMQLLPNTAAEFFPELKSSGSANAMMEAMLMDPHRNIELGVRYFTKLRKMFRGNMAQAIAAYNLGPSRVRDLLSNGLWRAEDNEYCKKVSSRYQMLKRYAQNNLKVVVAN